MGYIIILPEQQPPAPPEYLRYLFDETAGLVASDDTGNGRDGTIGTSVVLNQAPLAPNSTRSFQFVNTANSYVYGPQNLDGTAPTWADAIGTITMEAWVNYTPVITGGTLSVIMSLPYNDGTSNGFDVEIRTGQWNVNWNKGFGTLDQIFAGPATNGLHHIVAIADNTIPQIELYVDNVSVGSTPMTGTTVLHGSAIGSGQNTFVVGDFAAFGPSRFSAPWVGFIDDATLYDRVLSPAEINDHFLNGI